MTALAYYLLKVIICSGILFLYYHVALRNKLFHQWNRFYLLISILISLIAPIIQVSIIHYTSEEPNKAIKILQVFQSADGYLEEVTIRRHKGFSTDQWLMMAYFIISFILLFYLLLSLQKIFSIIKSHSIQWIEKIRFVSTNVHGTPFSFFNFIFWNEEIDIQTETGRQIFQHELVHVKEKHTLDKIMVQVVLVVFWCNPFFWLIRRELKLIHEFIADEKSVGEHGTAALAAMILKSSYSAQFNAITNQFFQTSIKRRLVMLTKIQNPKINYVSRILALPILAATVLAFTLRTKNITTPITKLDKQITVVIDAGHGMQNGKYSGAVDGGVYEDVITLAIATKIKQLNASNQVKIVLTRPSEEIVDLHKRVDIARDNNADLFISLHVNAIPPIIGSGKISDKAIKNGFEVLVSNKATLYQKQSEVLASAMQQELTSVYLTNPLLTKPGAGVWVLDQNICPSILIECGFITDKADKEFITKDKNQTAVAQKILDAIERYAQNQQGNEKTSLNVITNKEETNPIVTTTINSTSQKNKDKITVHDTTKKQPLYIVDRKEITKADLDKLDEIIDPSSIESINVLKGKTATDKYGKKGANGVVEIKLKEQKSNADITFKENGTPSATGTIHRDPSTNEPGFSIKVIDKAPTDTVPKTDPLFTKVEIEAAADTHEWTAFLQKNLQPVIEQAVAKGAKPGNYTVKLKFIVKKDGSASDFTALNDPGYGLADKVVAMMKDSPKWKPGLQNGKPVNSYHTQPVTFLIQEQ